MKQLMIFFVMFLGLFFTTSAMSHHAAEGIVSDEVWDMVDVLVADVHQDLDFDAVVDSMVVVTDIAALSACPGNSGCGGSLFLQTSAVVPDDDVDEILSAFDDAIAIINSAPKGTTTNGPMFVDAFDLDDDTSRIIVLEPIGSGNSQETWVQEHQN